jgi:hypothetical protein
MAAGVAIYGGFSGTETHRGARDAASRATILDGDFLGNDTGVAAVDSTNLDGNPEAMREDNSTHVVIAAASARVDGFSIEHGHSSPSDPIKGGGGLLVVDPDLTVANVDFVENSTTGWGGAIFCLERCDLTLENAKLVGNRALRGGAIHATPMLTFGARALSLESVELSGNWSQQSGGAVEVRGGVSVNVSDLRCGLNTTKGFGGCWFSLDSPTEIRGADFWDNVANEGGAIYSWRTSLTLAGVTIRNNQASYLGGGLLNYVGKAVVTGGSFSDNAARFGGGISTHSAELVLEETSIVQGTAEEYGGGLYGETSTVRLSDVTVSGSSARFGGGLFASGSTLTVEGSTLASNTASVSGGAIYLYNTSTLDLEESALLGNTATKFGGGLYVTNATPSLADSVVAGNVAEFGGGLYVTNATYSVTNSVVAGNFASNTGGGIYQWVNARADLSRVAFVGNRANFGVGLMVFGPAELRADRLAFVGNQGIGGGGLQLDAQEAPLFKVTVHDATFARNEVALDGAGMLILNGAEPTVAGATFLENVATRDGGGVAVGLSEPLLANVAFVSNLASNGGAIANGGSRPRIVHASFYDNRSQAGGGVYNDASSSAELKNSAFWASTGTGPDVRDLGSPSSVEYVMGAQVFSGSGNAVLSGDPFDLVQPGGRLFLNQGLVAPPTALGGGSNAVADDETFGFQALGMAPWATLTTASDGTLGGNVVDLGRHHSPAAAAIRTFNVTASEAAWTSTGVDACVLFNDADGTIRAPAADQLESGGLPHTHPSGTELGLVCFGPVGEPAVAFANVP